MDTNSPESSPAPSYPAIQAQILPPEQQASPNLLLAMAAGSVASLIGAVVWAAVTVATNMQIGWMAVGVGFLVGIAVGRFNPSGDTRLGYLGAVLALAGCLLGNVLSMLEFAANAAHVSFFQVLTQVDLAIIPSAMAEGFSPMDLLFYGIAIYEGFKFSVKGR
jgi:FtsH-binding integral membrane protein